MLLRSALLADGRVVDIVLAGASITAVTPTGTPDLGPRPAPPLDESDSMDLTGYLVLPAPVEPHAHLDKALTADLVANPDGDLLGAIGAWTAAYPDRTVEEIAGRARRAALRNLAHGCRAIRTHVDVNEQIGLRGVQALLEVKAELAPLVELQLVALMGRPLPGPAGAANRGLLAQALELGVDVVGGCPHIDNDRHGHLDLALEAAAAYQRPLDLHMDENLEIDSLDLSYLAQRVGQTGFAHGVVASHCTSLSMQSAARQDEIARQVAEAGISVVTLPQTNLFLQARGWRCAPPRGLTALAALLEAGVNVAAGADNLQDPFNPVGRGDPLETAALLMMAGHLDADQAYRAISAGARQAMGLPPVCVEAGYPGELLAIKAGSVREAIASAPLDRLVFGGGRLIARTDTVTQISARN